MKIDGLLSTEELCRKWPVESSADPIHRWWAMLRGWRESDLARLIRHQHFELIYRDGAAVFVYLEPRVLHLIWHAYEKTTHPLCVQLMLTHGPAIKAIVSTYATSSSLTSEPPQDSTEHSTLKSVA